MSNTIPALATVVEETSDMTSRRRSKQSLESFARRNESLLPSPVLSMQLRMHLSELRSHSRGLRQLDDLLSLAP